MLTRKDYMSGKCSFHEYYLAIAKTAGISRAPKHIMERVRKSTDEHYNDIPLGVWNSLSFSNYRKAFEAHGDFPSMAGLVCLWKTVARETLRRAT